jgi:hypothetical protein
MVIPDTAQFTYTVALQRGADGAWRGAADHTGHHKGLVGDAPAIALANGRLTLERTQTHDRLARDHRGHDLGHRLALKRLTPVSIS